MLSKLWNFAGRFKYAIVIVLGVLFVGVFDENSVLKRVEYGYQIDDPQDEITKYNNMYRDASARLYDLRHDARAIGRVARERYFMKANDEDIFVLSDDEKPTDKDTEDETVE